MQSNSFPIRVAAITGSSSGITLKSVMSKDCWNKSMSGRHGAELVSTESRYSSAIAPDLLKSLLSRL